MGDTGFRSEAEVPESRDTGQIFSSDGTGYYLLTWER